MGSKLPAMKTCPMCGSRRVRRRIMPVKLDERLTVEDVPVDQCANCGEQYFDPEALSLISAARHGHRAR